MLLVMYLCVAVRQVCAVRADFRYTVATTAAIELHVLWWVPNPNSAHLLFTFMQSKLIHEFHHLHLLAKCCIFHFTQLANELFTLILRVTKAQNCITHVRIILRYSPVLHHIHIEVVLVCFHIMILVMTTIIVHYTYVLTFAALLTSDAKVIPQCLVSYAVSTKVVCYITTRNCFATCIMRKLFSAHLRM